MRPPDPGGVKDVAVTATSVRLAPATGGLVLAGAWVLDAPDDRFGGWSGLALDGDRLVAVSDAGSWMAIAMPRPGPGRQQVAAQIGDLPRAASNRTTKVEADAESVTADRAGYWVGFEQRHRLERYDRQWRRTGQVIDLADHGWSPNSGAEGLAEAGDALLVWPEKGRGPAGQLVVRHGQAHAAGVAALPGESVGAEWLGGQLVLLRRGYGQRGFSGWIADPARGDSAVRLPLGWRDNPEGIAIQPTGERSARIWILTDDNFRWPLRTLLVAFDAPPGWRPGGGSDPAREGR